MLRRWIQPPLACVLEGSESIKLLLHTLLLLLRIIGNSRAKQHKHNWWFLSILGNYGESARPLIEHKTVVSKKWKVSFLQLLYHSTPVMITRFDLPFCFFCMRPTAPPPEHHRVELLKGVVGEQQQEWWQKSFRRTRDEASLQGAASDCLEIETVLISLCIFIFFLV